MTVDGAWFVYRRRPGKISAVPANWRGWLALAAFGLLPLGALGATRLADAPVWAMLAVSLGTGALSFWLLFRLVLARGRPG